MKKSFLSIFSIIVIGLCMSIITACGNNEENLSDNSTSNENKNTSSEDKKENESLVEIISDKDLVNLLRSGRELLEDVFYSGKYEEEYAIVGQESQLEYMKLDERFNSTDKVIAYLESHWTKEKSKDESEKFSVFNNELYAPVSNMGEIGGEFKVTEKILEDGKIYFTIDGSQKGELVHEDSEWKINKWHGYAMEKEELIEKDKIMGATAENAIEILKEKEIELNVTIESMQIEDMTINQYLGREYFTYKMGPTPPESLSECIVVYGNEYDYLISKENKDEVYRFMRTELGEISFDKYLNKGTWETLFKEGEKYGVEPMHEVAKVVVELIKNKDLEGLSEYINDTKGIRISSDAYVEESDLLFSKNAISKFFDYSSLYTWGIEDGTGFPIQLTTEEYWDIYIYDRDYANAEESINKSIGKGNTTQNHSEFFENSQFVEYYFEGTEENSYIDWSSLRLVFELIDGKWYLTGIVHDMWTI